MCNSLTTEGGRNYEMLGWKNCWHSKGKQTLVYEIKSLSKSERVL